MWNSNSPNNPGGVYGASLGMPVGRAYGPQISTVPKLNPVDTLTKMNATPPPSGMLSRALRKQTFKMSKMGPRY